MDEAFQQRKEAINRRDRLEEELNQLKKENKNPQRIKVVDEQLSTARRDVNNASEAMGERAAEAHIEQRYPGAKKIYGDGTSGSGKLDQVYQTKDGKYVVVEAKGGRAGELGTRKLPNGEVVQQGSREYLEDMTRLMSERGEPLGSELEKAMLEGKVQYEKVHARIGTSGGEDALKDIRISDFDISQ
jgi:hypothetical protein